MAEPRGAPQAEASGPADTPDAPGTPGTAGTAGTTSRARRLAGARPWGRHATEAAAGVGLLGLSWLLLADRTDRVPGWEVDVFDAVNRLPDALQWPIWPIMQLGTVAMYVVAGAVAYALTRRMRPALAAATSVLLAWLAARFVKNAIQRGRPGDLLDHIHLRGSEADGYGYVSGHTCVAFAWATVLTPLLPGRWRLVPFGLASGVGIARVYYGAHLPLDVLGGAGLGILCGLVASIAFGTIHPSRPDRGEDSAVGQGAEA